MEDLTADQLQDPFTKDRYDKEVASQKQYNDVLTKVLGRHSIKSGGELTRIYYLNNATYSARPSYTFHNLWDFANDAPYQESGQFNHSTGVPFANRQDNRLDIWGFFV